MAKCCRIRTKKSSITSETIYCILVLRGLNETKKKEKEKNMRLIANDVGVATRSERESESRGQHIKMMTSISLSRWLSVDAP